MPNGKGRHGSCTLGGGGARFLPQGFMCRAGLAKLFGPLFDECASLPRCGASNGLRWLCPRGWGFEPAGAGWPARLARVDENHRIAGAQAVRARCLWDRHDPPVWTRSPGPATPMCGCSAKRRVSGASCIDMIGRAVWKFFDRGWGYDADWIALDLLSQASTMKSAQSI